VWCCPVNALEIADEIGRGTVKSSDLTEEPIAVFQQMGRPVHLKGRGLDTTPDPCLFAEEASLNRGNHASHVRSPDVNQLHHTKVHPTFP
jgi:hypothetical protein